MAATPSLGVRIPPDLRQRAEHQAHREDRTLSQVIRRTLDQHVDPVPAGCTCTEPVLSEDDGRWCARCRRAIGPA
jgi:hypothetical protein